MLLCVRFTQIVFAVLATIIFILALFLFAISSKKSQIKSSENKWPADIFKNFGEASKVIEN